MRYLTLLFLNNIPVYDFTFCRDWHTSSQTSIIKTPLVPDLTFLDRLTILHVPKYLCSLLVLSTVNLWRASWCYGKVHSSCIRRILHSILDRVTCYPYRFFREFFLCLLCSLFTKRLGGFAVPPCVWRTWGKLRSSLVKLFSNPGEVWTGDEHAFQSLPPYHSSTLRHTFTINITREH